MRQLFLSVTAIFLIAAGSFAQEEPSNQPDAQKIQKVYDSLWNKYQMGRTDYWVLPQLVKKAKEIRKDELAKVIADDYIEHYLLKLPYDSIVEEGYFNFLLENVNGTQSSAFKWLAKNREQVNKMPNKGKAVDKVLSLVLEFSYLFPKLTEADKEKREPSWNELRSEINAMVTSDGLVEEVLLDGKMTWYGMKQKWPLYCNSVVEKVNRFGPYGMFPDLDWRLNFNAWELFLKSEDVQQLQVALKWSDSAIKLANPVPVTYYDTYANLLYKLGDVKDALFYQEKAAALDPSAEDIKENLEKMRLRQPTWPDL